VTEKIARGPSTLNDNHNCDYSVACLVLRRVLPPENLSGVLRKAYKARIEVLGKSSRSPHLHHPLLSCHGHFLAIKKKEHLKFFFVTMISKKSILKFFSRHRKLNNNFYERGPLGLLNNFQ
jgi:hypothetical protein